MGKTIAEALEELEQVRKEVYASDWVLSPQENNDDDDRELTEEEIEEACENLICPYCNSNIEVRNLGNVEYCETYVSNERGHMQYQDTEYDNYYQDDREGEYSCLHCQREFPDELKDAISDSM